ncbi:MAG TPA: NAD(P)/FAD-dependent oxidoreductase [Mycobacteriales bacterium]|nr:NAD(P)/FAD-dependent oxidoreductase [Mycobacteriales bacterium]
MRISVVGAGVAGLTAAVALQRDGHDVRVHEQASELRTGGFGFNLWTNAVSPLHALGVAVPGEPFDHVNFRTGGRHRVTMRMTSSGQPHMNVDRGALLRSIYDNLAPDTVRFDERLDDATQLLAEGADLVVAADGVGSRLRPDAALRRKISKPWAVWQAVIPEGGALIEEMGGAIVLGKERFYGLWRHPKGELCWFVEAPALPTDTTADELLAGVAEDEDPLVRKIAALTPVDRLGQWLARDRRPTRRIIGDRIVAIGDAAHPMLPCIGQGACTSIEDGVALAVALRSTSVQDGLVRYRRRRLSVTSTRVATAHLACTLRRPSPAATAVAATPLGIPFAYGAGAWMRVINRADRRLLRQLAPDEPNQPMN